MNKEITRIKDKILPILKEYRVTKAGIFGSHARGEQKKKSDIDLLVEIKENISLTEIIHLRNLLQKNLKKKVDLVEYDTIRKELKESILNEEIQLL